MNKARYTHLMDDIHATLTTEEKKEGWHFCIEFDQLLTQGEEIDEQGRCAFCQFDKRKV